MTSVTTWIVAMLGNGSSCLQYLQNLFTAIKSFYHPSNTGKFQQELIMFLSKLTQAVVDRIHLFVSIEILFKETESFSRF